MFRIFFTAALLLITVPSFAQEYKLGPDSNIQPGVPQGKVTHHTWTSRIYPGTTRDYWVYVPAQYDPSKPACVMVFQDGGGFQDVNGGFRVPIVFDNLISKKEMPPTIAIMINPGVVPAEGPNAQPRFNRSYEYDALGDRYARFLIEEILPEVGKSWNLSKDPNDHAICGSSSGGIAAFTAAWERPDVFRRVISYIGSFTNLRGGHAIPALIRKTEPKPLRIFQQDGSNDQDIYSGSWFIGNNDVAAALKFGGYETTYVVGTGGHDGRQSGAIFPDALRYIWKGYPAPVAAAQTTKQPVLEVLKPNEGWEKLTGDVGIGILAAAPDGSVAWFDQLSGMIRKWTENSVVDIRTPAWGPLSGMAFGPTGELLVSSTATTTIFGWPSGGTNPVQRVVASGRPFGAITVTDTGRIYAVDNATGEILLIEPQGRPIVVHDGMPRIRNIVLTPDHQHINASTQAPEPMGWSFHVKPDGKLDSGQEYFDFHMPYGQSNSGANGLAMDEQGRFFAASTVGIQVLDQPGRVTGIISNPTLHPTKWVVFGGKERDQLFCSDGVAVYRRRTRAKGSNSALPPVKPPAPRL